MPADLTGYLGCGQEDFKTTKAVFVFVVGRSAVIVSGKRRDRESWAWRLWQNSRSKRSMSLP